MVQYFWDVTVAPHRHTPKTWVFVDELFDQINAVDSCQLCRMSQESFVKVCGLIAAHPTFQNESHHEQAPVELQLVCALEHLGKSGNGASLGSLK